MQRRHANHDEGGINITPMLDIVFIMLIFFIVTTSFVREAGLDVSRPASDQARLTDEQQQLIVLRIDDDDAIHLGDRVIDRRAVRANVERAVAEQQTARVVVAASRASHTEILVDVVDAVRQAGVDDVSVAAERQP